MWLKKYPLSDIYITLGKPAFGDFRDRGSKFFAYAYRVYTIEEAKSCLALVKKEHPKARHHCFAYRFGMDKHQYRANDDGEPSGTAGRPILGQIDSFGLTNVMVVVVRYFGGTKLGVPGLINAYRQATVDALSTAETEEKTIDHLYQLSFDYAVMSDVMTLLKKQEAETLEQDYGVVPALKIAIRQAAAANLEKEAAKIKSVTLTFLSKR